MSIYIITHKAYNTIKKLPKHYKSLLVGSEIGNKGLPSYLKDNVGVNISNKNSSYCELTGEYWVWKNTDDNIIGFDHYRRYFVKKNYKFLKVKPLEYFQIKEVLVNNDIILPEKIAFEDKSAKEQFVYRHGDEVWYTTQNIIEQLYPEYLEDYVWFGEQRMGYAYNMFITTRSLLNEYFIWLFNILSVLEEKIDLSRYDKYNRRMYGFISERLMNVWLHHNKLDIIEFPVHFDTELSLMKRGMRKIGLLKR